MKEIETSILQRLISYAFKRYVCNETPNAEYNFGDNIL